LDFVIKRTINFLGFCSCSENAVFSGEGSYIIQTLANQQKLFLRKQHEVEQQIGLLESWFVSDFAMPSFGYLQNYDSLADYLLGLQFQIPRGHGRLFLRK
jgi:hypothetical protein